VSHHAIAAPVPGRLGILIGKDPGPGPAQEAEAGLAPRVEYVELARAVRAEILGYVPEDGGWLRRFFDPYPLIASSLNFFRRRSEFDTVYVTGEDVGLRVAPLLLCSGWRGQMVMAVHRCVEPRRIWLFKRMGHSLFSHFICVSSAQCEVLIKEVGFPAEKISFVPYRIDTGFFAPPKEPTPVAERGYVFACGMENRDYDTLKAAARLVSYPFEVVASGYQGSMADSVRGVPNVKVYDYKLTYIELRRLYAQARFVVVPLHPLHAAAGLTGLLEGMAMGQAMIVTASPGLSDYLVGDNGIITIPPHDPDALARAVSELWADPARCEEMGRRNRTLVETLDSFRGYVEKTSAFMGCTISQAGNGFRVQGIA